ncbi:MAG: PAS domain S-box protein [Anaerolineales bacterium]|nr:PAS domain S-box protein [Anaerolineales bacterium]
MQWSANPYFYPLLIAGLIGLLNVLFISRRSKVPGAIPLLAMGFAVSEWALAYAMEMASSNIETQIFWGKIQYFGIVSVSVTFLLFALTYAQYQKVLRSKWIWLLWVFPLLCIYLIWTNESHHLIWTKINQMDFGTYSIAAFGHGPVFYILVAYSYLTLIAGSVVLVRQAIKSQPEFRSQTFLLVFGVAINWVGNIIYVSGANPIPDLDWTPMGLILSGVIYSIALFQFRFLDLTPIAGETVLESMDDIVIVLDDHNRLVYLNNAFEYYFQTNPRKLIGSSVSSAFASWPELISLCNQHNTTRSEVTVSIPKRDHLQFDVRVSNIRWQKNYAMGRVLVLKDVTEQKQAETRATLFYELRAQNGKADRIPMVLMYRVFDEMIIEVNRAFLLVMGYERMKLLGRSMLDGRLWEPYQRAEFLRAFNRERTLHEYPLTLKHYNGTDRALIASIQPVEIGGTSYVVILAHVQDKPAD